MDLELENYSYEERKRTTINQCLNDLIAGYADADVSMELGKHFMELMEDEYFLQWPLIRYRYASNLLTGYFGGCSEDDYIRGNPELGLKLLVPMAEAGLATAQYDLGRYYQWEEHQEDIGWKWVVKASRQGYYRANRYVYNCWHNIMPSNISIDTKKEFFVELERLYTGQPLGDLAKKCLLELRQQSEEVVI